MAGRPAATGAARWAGLALLAALGMLATVDAGCSQLLGIADIAAGDGATVDSIRDGSAADADSTGVDSGGEPNGTDAGACPGDLSNVHAGDFLISFRLQTNQSDRVIALLNQRLVCDQSVFWDVQLVNYQMYIELSDSPSAGGYVFINSTSAPLNDDRPHDVVITRTKGVLQIVVDGKVVGSRAADQSLGALASLRIGDDVCVGGDGTVALRGSITNICVRPN